MIKRVQIIGHIKSAADLFLGRAREVTVNTTDDAVRVHDGATLGGTEMARKDVANVPPATGAVDGKMTASQAGDLSTVVADFATHDGGTSGHPVATPSVDGFMSAADKTILDDHVGTGGTEHPDATGSVSGFMSGADKTILDADTVTLAAHTGAGGSAHADVIAGGADGFMTGADKTKLDGIEASADVNDTPAELLAAIKTVDGSGSGLDADVLDGLSQTSSPTANTIVRRDGSGRTAIVSPSASDDATPKSYVDAVIPSGTVMLFFQADAPTGWTRITTQNNKAFRVVSSSGGGTSGAGDGFTTVFGTGKVTGGTTLTAAQSGVPAHSHGDGTYAAASNGAHTHDILSESAAIAGSSNIALESAGPTDGFITTDSTGAHTHDVTGTSANNSTAGAASSHNHTRGSMNLQYINIVMGSKNA